MGIKSRILTHSLETAIIDDSEVYLVEQALELNRNVIWNQNTIADSMITGLLVLKRNYHRLNLVIIDMQLHTEDEAQTGLLLLKKFRDWYQKKVGDITAELPFKIIAITNHPQFAFSLSRIKEKYPNILGIVSKQPIYDGGKKLTFKDQLWAMIDKYLEQAESEIFIPVRQVTNTGNVIKRLVPMNQIFYVEASNKNSRMMLSEGLIDVKDPFKYFKRFWIDYEEVVQCYKSYLVFLNKVVGINQQGEIGGIVQRSGVLVLSNDCVIPIGRSYLKAIKAKFEFSF